MISSWRAHQISQYYLQKGGIIAYATEAVYGLGCDPLNPAAVQRLLRIKNRPLHKGLILVAADYQQILPYIQPLADMSAVLATWPGPYTWLLPKSKQVPIWISGASDRVAVRVSAHPLVQQLCLAFGSPLVSTSANPSGLPPPKSIWSLRRYRLPVDYIVPGHTGGLQQPSRIIDAISGQILR